MQEAQFHSLREGSIVEIDCKPGWTRLEISSNFAAIVFLGGSRFLSIFSTPSLRVVAHSSWTYRGDAERTIGGFDSEGRRNLRRGAILGTALKKTRVIWQSATLCRVKKAASSLNNARLFRSQRFRVASSPSQPPSPRKGEASNRVAFSRFRAVGMQMVRIWVAPFRQSGIGGRGENSSIDEKQSGLEGKSWGFRSGGACESPFPFTSARKEKGIDGGCTDGNMIVRGRIKVGSGNKR